MKRFIVGMSALALGGCGESINDQLGNAKAAMESAQEDINSLQNPCAFGPERTNDEIRKEALAEWDKAAGENLDEISPEQEWEIRKSLGARMNLAPSEVDGWKDIYRDRAKRAKIEIASANETRALDERLRQAQKELACKALADSKRSLEVQQSEVRRLEKELR